MLSSVRKNLSSVRTAWDIRLKKLLSVRTARAIRSEKNLATVRATEAICSKVNFIRVSIPKPFRLQPLASNDVLFSRSHTLRVLFPNVSYMNSYASLLAFKLSIDYRQYRHTFQSILKFFFPTSFPKIIFFIFALLQFMSQRNETSFSLHVENTKHEK